MRTKDIDIIMRDSVFVWIALATGLLMLIPLIAMQFTNEVDWDLRDFIIMGALIFGTGAAYVLIASFLHSKEKRLAVGLVLAVLFLLTWAELAVGIFGTPFAGS